MKPIKKIAVVISSVAIGCVQYLPDPSEPDIQQSLGESLPDYLPPAEGHAEALMFGDVSPFSGVLLDEQKALGAANLRIAYDELYRLSELNHTAYGLTITVYQRELSEADRELEAYRSIEASWWTQHRMAVGIITGVVIGIGGTIGTGAIWIRISD